MLDIGRVCVKLAGRDAGQLAVVIEKVDKNFVVIDGNVRRRKCNIKHLEPLDKVLEIKEKASTEDVLSAMKKEKLKVAKKEKKKERAKTKQPKPVNQKKAKKGEK